MLVSVEKTQNQSVKDNTSEGSFNSFIQTLLPLDIVPEKKAIPAIDAKIIKTMLTINPSIVYATRRRQKPAYV